jgi:hypothetical protein
MADGRSGDAHWFRAMFVGASGAVDDFDLMGAIITPTW